MERRVTLNVTGKIFKTSMSTLATLPHTKLYRVCSKPDDYPDIYSCEQNEFYFDRNPKMAHAVLGLYRTGMLHLPNNLCSQVVKQELDFWEIPETSISNCCWPAYSQSIDSARLTERYLWDLEEMRVIGRYRPQTLREKIWMVLEYPFHSTATKIWNALYLLIVMVAVVLIILSYSPAFRVPNVSNGTTFEVSFEKDVSDYYRHTSPKFTLVVLDTVCLAFFILELVLRFATSPNRLQLFKNQMVILDILVVFSYLIVLLQRVYTRHATSDTLEPFAYYVNMLLPLRALRVVHFMQRMAVSKMFAHSVKKNIFELTVVMVTTFTCVIVCGTVAFCLERFNRTKGLKTLPDAMWWSLATVTTVGYGDVYPESGAGRISAGVSLVFGVILISMPTAVILASFSRAHFIVSSMIGRSSLAKAPSAVNVPTTSTRL